MGFINLTILMVHLIRASIIIAWVAKLKKRVIVTASLLLLCLLSGSCAPAQDFDTRLSSIVEPYRFSIIGWEFQALSSELGQWIFGGSQETGDEVDMVVEYFAIVKRMKPLRSEIEALKTGDSQGDLASLGAELDLLQEEE